ncbi:hypothetical protein ILUMI_04030 [Ignelater luminosus]|uniref:PiggyBac transposable element-derived protein domain-containing protein n=1 Tax=Ignelater luminosus TaxID=2038154 RepID=A0A8K0DKK6_IGNLU|nr:hypothetical protein ILUMI_04030 [Ignelater luminosus]
MAIDSKAKGDEDVEDNLASTSTSSTHPSYASSDDVEESATRDDLEDDVLDQELVNLIMANKRGLSDAELELELHGLPEDCSDLESNVSDEDLSPASDSDKDFISRPSSSSNSDENLECAISRKLYMFYRKKKRDRGRGILRGKRRAVGQLRGRSSNFISYASEASTSNYSQPESKNATSEVCVTTFQNSPVFSQTMGRNRFKEILRYLRFDMKNSRPERQKTNKFALVSETWNKFIKNCLLCYKPEQDVTVNEQLFSSKARCNFTQFMANRPDKFGIKFWMLADVKPKYMYKAFPYLGKDELSPEG